MDKNDKRVDFRLPWKLKNRLEKLAAQHRISVSELIRQLVERGLE